MSDIKMIDRFIGNVRLCGDTIEDDEYAYVTLCGAHHHESQLDGEYIVHAINDHDRLTEENAQLKSQLHDLFEHVSGVSVNEYKQEQMPYLADYIIGQAEADSMCIEKLKADKAELIKALNGVMNIVAVSTGIDGYHCNGDTACWWDFDEIAEVSELIQKHKEPSDD